MSDKKHHDDFEQGDLFSCCQPPVARNGAESVTAEVKESADAAFHNNSAAAPAAPRPVRTVPMPGREDICNSKRRSGDLEPEAERQWASQQLKKVRESLGLSPEDVQRETYVWANKIRALENCDYDSLPQTVYVLAYVRKLCDFYKLSEAETEELVKPWLNIQCEIPENLAASVSPDTDSETRRQQKRMELIILAVMALILIAVIAVITVVVASCTRTPKTAVKRFRAENTLKLQETPKLRAVPVKK